MEMEVDKEVAARMGYEDVRATFVTSDGFTEVALLGPGSVFGKWSVVAHHGCDPDDPSAGSSEVNDYPDEMAAVQAYSGVVGAFRTPGGPHEIAALIRGSLARGEEVPVPLLEAAVAALEKTPTVFFSVHSGMGEVRAVDGTVNVYHVDLDREGDSLTDDGIEGILVPFEMTGTAGDVEAAIAEAREVLEGFKETPSP